MMQQEFEKMMGISDEGMRLILNDEVYKVIEEMYMESEDESKEQFCQRVKERQLIHKAADGIISEKNAKIVELEERAGRSENREKSITRDLDKAISQIERQDSMIQELQKEIDTWRKKYENARKELTEAEEREIHLKAELYDFIK